MLDRRQKKTKKKKDLCQADHSEGVLERSYNVEHPIQNIAFTIVF